MPGGFSNPQLTQTAMVESYLNVAILHSHFCLVFGDMVFGDIDNNKLAKYNLPSHCPGGRAGA
jgi:hypothetical protein